MTDARPIVKVVGSPLIVSREIAIDWGLIPADTPPEPTPVERALAILAPHLNGLALYRKDLS